MKVELDLSNYATNEYLENAAGVDTSKFAKTVDLASLQSEIDELETTLVDLSKLIDVMKNEVVKKTVYDELVKKVNVFQTTDSSNLFS